jgi:hypothetical protein
MLRHAPIESYLESLGAHPTVLSQEARCPVCLDLCDNHTPQRWHNPIIETYCKHVFHYVCLHRWVSAGNANCPVCREVFYDLPCTPGQILDDAECVSPLDDTIPLVVSRQNSYEGLRERLFDAGNEFRFEENQVLRMFEDTAGVQHEQYTAKEKDDSRSLSRQVGDLPTDAMQLYHSASIHRVGEGKVDWQRTDSLPLDQLMPEF